MIQKKEKADDCKKPHKIIDGQIIINTNKNGDKYRKAKMGV